MQSHANDFKRLFGRISLRHSKRLVRHEIYIPQQKRHVITMPFTAVEEQHYQTLFRNVVGRCGLSQTGQPLRDDWDPNDPKTLEHMRAALDRLRQTALHPQVGSQNRRALGRRNGPVRTVAEVLDVMIDNSEVAIRTDQRAMMLTALVKGQIWEQRGQVDRALAIWLAVLRQNQVVIEDFRKNLKLEIELGKASNPDATSTDKEGNDNRSDDTKDDESDGVNTVCVGEARRRLRSALEVQHRAMFFCANARFQLKSKQKPNSVEFQRLEKLEQDGYEQAKQFRLEILEESRQKTLKLMNRISTQASEQSFATIPEYQALSPKGIDSRNIAEGLIMLAGQINDQADILDEWREHVIQLLRKPLVDEEGDMELTGEEYEDSTKLMDEIVVYTMILRAAIADREEALTGQVNKLVEHEVKTSLRYAKDGHGPDFKMLIELLQVRQRLKPKASRSGQRVNSVKAHLFELRSAFSKLKNDADRGSSRAKIELDIIDEQVKTTQNQLTKQLKITRALDQELNLFTATMNARVEFYRQLQNVSDQVAPYEGPTNDHTLESVTREETALLKRLDLSQSKHRYLLHLKEMESSGNGESRMCAVCRDDFTVGVLTVCGHQFCKECVNVSLLSQLHRRFKTFSEKGGQNTTRLTRYI